MAGLMCGKRPYDIACFHDLTMLIASVAFEGIF